jgi:hypothetical protein
MLRRRSQRFHPTDQPNQHRKIDGGDGWTEAVKETKEKKKGIGWSS